MADPTVTLTRDHLVDPHRIVVPIKNAEPLVVGGLAAINSSGTCEFADDASGLTPAGVVVGQAVGDTSSTGLTGDASGINKAVLRGSIVLKSVTVTGASAITDKGKPVYATDGQTLTLTRPSTYANACGYVMDWISSTTCDVYIFSYLEALRAQLEGRPNKGIIEMTVHSNGLGNNGGDTVWTFTSQNHFTIDSLSAHAIAIDNALIAGAQTLTMKIGGVATTGGVLTLGFANADAAADLGVAINATAITAANEVHVGDTVTLNVISGGTGFTADLACAFRVYALITYLPGA